MFDVSWSADLDAAAMCEQVTSTQVTLQQAEWQELAVAAQWAVLHRPESRPETTSPERSARGERMRCWGGEGTPEVAEFAAAELGLLMGTGVFAAANLIRDVLDLQHRHPDLWDALAQGRGRVWKARHVARLVHTAVLTRDQAWFVDRATTPYLATLPWASFTRLVEARIIEADPQAAEARRLAAAMDRFVTTGQSNEHGLKTLIAKATAGDVIVFVAVCDRIAQLLELRGDIDPIDVRRSKALGYLANPALALALLEEHATSAPHPHDPFEPESPEPEPPGPAPATAPGRAAGAGRVPGRSSTPTSSVPGRSSTSESPKRPSGPGSGWPTPSPGSVRSPSGPSGTCWVTIGSPCDPS